MVTTAFRLFAFLLRGSYAFNRTADFETVRQIKEKFCYVAYDIGVERRLAQETTVCSSLSPHKLPLAPVLSDEALIPCRCWRRITRCRTVE